MSVSLSGFRVQQAKVNRKGNISKNPTRGRHIQIHAHSSSTVTCPRVVKAELQSMYLMLFSCSCKDLGRRPPPWPLLRPPASPPALVSASLRPAASPAEPAPNRVADDTTVVVTGLLLGTRSEERGTLRYTRVVDALIVSYHLLG